MNDHPAPSGATAPMADPSHQRFRAPPTPVGLSIVGVNLFLMYFGNATKRYTAWNKQTASSFGPVDITRRDLVAGLVALAALVAVALTLQRTRLGKAMRAVSDNPDLASSTGIDSQKIIRIVWFIGGALAALGGIVRGLDEGVKGDMGANLLFLMFAGITDTCMMAMLLSKLPYNRPRPPAATHKVPA